jgi:hypothetical protein
MDRESSAGAAGMTSGDTPERGAEFIFKAGIAGIEQLTPWNHHEIDVQAGRCL